MQSDLGVQLGIQILHTLWLPLREMGNLFQGVFNHDFVFVLANIIPDLVNDIFANDTTGPVKYHSGLWHKVGAI